MKVNSQGQPLHSYTSEQPPQVTRKQSRHVESWSCTNYQRHRSESDRRIGDLQVPAGVCDPLETSAIVGGTP